MLHHRTLIAVLAVCCALAASAVAGAAGDSATPTQVSVTQVATLKAGDTAPGDVPGVRAIRRGRAIPAGYELIGQKVDVTRGAKAAGAYLRFQCPGTKRLRSFVATGRVGLRRRPRLREPSDDVHRQLPAVLRRRDGGLRNALRGLPLGIAEVGAPPGLTPGGARHCDARSSTPSRVARMISATGFDPATLERFADLLVGFGANVQPGQIVSIGAEIGKEEIARALAASAYRHGAKFVDVDVLRPARQARAAAARAARTRSTSCRSWYGERILALGDQRCARIGLSGPIAPGLLDDLDPARAGRDQLPFLKESGKVVNDATTNWTIGPLPDAGRGRGSSIPDLDRRRGARAAGGAARSTSCRLDEADPVAAWTARADTLVAAAERLTARRFDALHFERPGHRPDRRPAADQPLAWPPASRRSTASSHMPNLPSEEIFTAPDPLRTEGVVRATKPLALGGSIIRGLEVALPRAAAPCAIDADENAEVLRGYAAKRRGRRAAGRGRARRPRGPHRPARHRLLRHAARRERGQPHRARLGVRDVPRRRRRPRADQQEPDPRRLHDRLGRRDGLDGVSADGTQVPGAAPAATGSSSDVPRARRYPSLPPSGRRGAGAVERARLEIA